VIHSKLRNRAVESVLLPTGKPLRWWLRRDPGLHRWHHHAHRAHRPGRIASIRRGDPDAL